MTRGKQYQSRLIKENEKIGAYGTHVCVCVCVRERERESRNVRRSSVPELEGKRSFGIPRRRRNDNNKMDIKEIM